MTRLRRPSSYYISFWQWANIAKMQRHDNRTHGSNMVDWACGYRNIQAALLLGDLKLALEPEYVGVHRMKPHAIRAFHAFDDPKHRERSLAHLERTLSAFDLVGLVERFDETLLLAADLTGLQHLTHSKVSPPPKNRAEVLTTAKALGCESRAGCEQKIAACASVDQQMYDRAAASFDERVRAQGPEFEQRLLRLRRLRAARESSDKVRTRRERDAEKPIIREKVLPPELRSDALLRQPQPLSGERLGRHGEIVLDPQRAAQSPAAQPRESSYSRLMNYGIGVVGEQIDCRGLFGGGGAAASRACRLIYSDTQFTMPWRLPKRRERAAIHASRSPRRSVDQAAVLILPTYMPSYIPGESYVLRYGLASFFVGLWPAPQPPTHTYDCSTHTRHTEHSTRCVYSLSNALRAGKRIIGIDCNQGKLISSHQEVLCGVEQGGGYRGGSSECACSGR